MNRRGFLRSLGLGGIVTALAAPEVIRKFDPTLTVVDDPKIALPKGIQTETAFQSFQYLLGHDKYGRIFMHNLLNGEWIMYDKRKREWVASIDPYKLPPRV